MNYKKTVDKVMTLLKEKEVCLSSRKSHRDCYESLELYMKQRNEGYSDAIRESWLSDSWPQRITSVMAVHLKNCPSLMASYPWMTCSLMKRKR